MAQQSINIGSAPNDGTGDVLRVAMTKTNDNFTELYTSVAGKIESTEKGITNGVATLDSDGTVPVSQIPAAALVAVSVVIDEVSQLALTAEQGDIAIRNDLNVAFIHNGGSAGDMTDWHQLTPVVFTQDEDGVVPAPTATNGYFLKDDATWAAPAWDDLSDATDLAVGEADKIVVVNATGDGIVFGPLISDLATATHTHTFNDLTDVVDYTTGDAGKVYIVNVAEDGLELGPVLGSMASADTGDYATSTHTHAPADIDFTDARLLGRSTAGAGSGEEITIGAGLSLDTSELALADIADATILGNNTGSAGAPIALDATATKTLLALENVDNTADVDKPVSTATQAALDAKVDAIQIGVQSGSYTLTATDAGDFVTVSNAGAVTLTVPVNANVGFVVGTRIYIQAGDAGVVTIAGEDDSGVSGEVTVINSLAGNLNIAGQYGVVTLVKTATNTWSAFGDLSA